jgi:hypothetical protein
VRPKIRADPEVPIRHLRNGVNRALEKALSDRPCLVRVLIDVEGWIQAEGARTQSPGQHKPHGGL